MTQLQRLVLASDQRCDDRIRLTTEQQHYLYRVLRLRAGDQFIAMDGQGHWWLAALANGDQAVILKPLPTHTELAVSVRLVLAMPKAGMEDVVRQVTELGVHSILPVISQRTVLNPSTAKLDRWRRIAQEAAEQSERQVVPDILSPQPWSQILPVERALSSTELPLAYLCQARGEHPHLLTRLLTQFPTHNAITLAEPPPLLTVAIGPEGGWTEAEVAEALTAGYQPVSLGSRILRAVTAPIVAMSLIASVFDMMPPSAGAV